jgi:ribosomal protein S18 acetylase RimI-like enzyme
VALLLFREACQGLGYGKETTAALEDALVRCGFRTLRLSVGVENPEARAFWERIGFAEVGRLDRGVSVLEKRLA